MHPLDEFTELLDDAVLAISAVDTFQEHMGDTDAWRKALARQSEAVKALIDHAVQHGGAIRSALDAIQAKAGA
jgi:hypothetical protein